MLHYQRVRLYGSIDLPAKPSPSTYFWNQVQKTATCWLWMGKDVTQNGYGRFAYRVAKYDHRRTMAHRWAYEEAIGAIPEGMTPDHLCKNRLCVNPAHMELVTFKENILRSDNPMALNARKTHCPKRHPYNEANTRRGGKGERVCAQCRRDKAREAHRRKRGDSLQLPPGERTHCPQGHEYTPENTYTSPRGSRTCRECLRTRGREFKRRKRAHADTS